MLVVGRVQLLLQGIEEIMSEPSRKSPEMEAALGRLFGFDRVKTIREDRCVACKGAAEIFRDKISAKEYTISGMCQECQDGTFS